MGKEVFKLAFSDTIGGTGFAAELLRTDPEFVERFGCFAFDEAAHQGSLDEHTRFLVILAALLGGQGVEAFAEIMPAALRAGVTPSEIKELVYQATAYLGFGRVFPFLKAVNETLTAQGVALPLEGAATTTRETRLEAGVQAQMDIFGEGMRDF